MNLYQENIQAPSLRTHIETFSIIGTETVNTDDWWSSGSNYTGKYGLNFSSVALITDVDGFATDKIEKGFAPIVPFKSTVKNIWVTVFHNGGGGSIEYAVRSYELPVGTYNGNAAAGTNNVIVGQKVISSVNPQLQHIKLDIADMDINHICKQSSFLALYFRRVGTVASVPLQRFAVTVELEEVL